MVVAKALSDLLSPVKMNYEIHGNTIPHLHVHLYPRFPDDPFVGGPIDSRRKRVVRTHEERMQLGLAIRKAASRAGKEQASRS